MHPYDRAFRLVLPVAAVAILLTVVAVGWFTQPDRFEKGYAPIQPIPYSHRLHAGTLKIPCQYCHVNATRSRVAGVPSVETCMNCHRVTKTDSPYIQQLTAIYKSGKPMEWKRIHSLPDHVYFDHRPHVNGGIACQTCHGEIQTEERGLPAHVHADGQLPGLPPRPARGPAAGVHDPARPRELLRMPQVGIEPGSRRAGEPEKEMKNPKANQDGRRGFLTGVAAAAASVLLLRLGGRGVATEDRVQPTEPGGEATAPKLPPPKGSVKRRG